MKVCLAEYCDSNAAGLGYCNKHYKRLRRHGDHKVITSPRNQAREYLENVVFPYGGDDCLIWPFARKTDGYGAVFYAGKKRIVSRLVCEKTNGPCPESGIEAAHSCGNGHLGCVTQRHLSWKTRSENQADRLIHGTYNRGSKAAASKLREDDVIEIMALLSRKTQSEIASLFGVRQQSISKIATGKNWQWLTSTQGLSVRGATL